MPPQTMHKKAKNSLHGPRSVQENPLTIQGKITMTRDGDESGENDYCYACNIDGNGVNDKHCPGNSEDDSEDKGHHKDDDEEEHGFNKVIIDNDGDNSDVDDDDDDDDDNANKDDSGIPIDKGRAWLVMISCFLMNILVVGGGKSFGVFVQEFQDQYNVGAKQLGVINGMALMLMLGLGIFVNMLAVRFSARRVVTAGSLLTSVGFIMTAFIPSFDWLYVTYGLVTGMGLALCFSPTIVMVGQCFKKYRSLAYGFALSGAGLGAFAFPGLARVLINQYNLQGCLLIIGGIMLNVAICGFLLPPHKRTTKNNKSDSNKKNIIFTRGGEMRLRKDADDVLDNDIDPFINCDNVAHMNFVNRNIDIETINDMGLTLEIEILPPESEEELFENGSDYGKITSSSGHLSLPKNGTDDHRTDFKKVQNKHLRAIEDQSNISKSANFLFVPKGNQVDTNRNDLLFHQTRKDSKSLSTSHLPDHTKPKTSLNFQSKNVKSSHNRISTSLAYISNCDLAMASQGHLERFSPLTSKSHQSPEENSRAGDGSKKKQPALFEWSLLSDPPFIMHFISAHLGYICYISNIFMLADYANACGLNRDTAAFTLSVVGILELVARLSFPPITEVLCCQKRRAWAVALMVMGALNLFAPHMKTLTSLMTYAVLFGYACGCFTTLIPVLCAESKGPEKMGSSFGLTTIAMGLAVMTGPPICGAIKDKLGQWDYGFITVGCLSMVASVSSLLEPWVKNMWEARDSKSEKHSHNS